ncbi:hypothetical protein [Actinomadura decatromicini]|uniref:hypothetical protein n=1 Tax=Actinomadura decatromicini TaxID=2604572 RepID=UPI001FE4E512|nr:hypothetical protein [Actinomadura decatromicini]
MNSESDQRPGGAARARESAPDPPAATRRTPAPDDPALPDDSAPAPAVSTRPGPQGDIAPDEVREITPEEVRERLRRRAIFLRELAEARELRRRVTPHRSRRARIHAALRRRTFRIN